MHDYIFQVIAAVGGVLVNVDSTESCPTAAIQEALDDDTAAVVHYLGKQTLEQLAEVVAVAEPRSIPVIVDAAAQLPPRSNLTEPVRLGAGLVVFSGGKALRGSQSSGLVVGKEELMGLLAAVELFLDGSDEEDHRRLARRRRADRQGIDDVRARVDEGDELFFPGGVPRVRIELLGDRTAPRRRAQHLHGRLGRWHVRRPDGPAVGRGPAGRPRSPRSADAGLERSASSGSPTSSGPVGSAPVLQCYVEVQLGPVDFN